MIFAYFQIIFLSWAILHSCSRMEFSIRILSSPFAPCNAVFSLSSLLEVTSSSALFSSSAKFSLRSELCIFCLTLSVNTPPSFVMLSITSRALKKRFYKPKTKFATFKNFFKAFLGFWIIFLLLL